MSEAIQKDIIIIGAGPAGMTAAIYGQRAGKSTLMIEAKAYGGKIINTPDIENYPGFEHISGFEYAQRLYNQATALGAELVYATATGIEKLDEHRFIVHTTSGDFEGRAVIVATGAKSRALGLAREADLIGRGISYCATCDGMFFRKKDVAVQGGGDTAFEDAAFLANYCNKVYIIHRRDAFTADEVHVAKLRDRDNVEFILNTAVTDLIGEERLEAVELTDKVTGEKRTLPVSGLFVAIGQAPDNAAFDNVLSLDEKGYVVASEECLTGTDGVYVAGDCRKKKVHQLTTAAADGAVSALAAVSGMK